MKKTLTLLTAAAALAAGVISTQAQTVYSQNIVGYANVVMQPGKFALQVNPLDNGAGNVLSNLFVAPVGATIVQVWNGAGFTPYKFQAGHWKNNINGTNADNFRIAPGTGYFITPAGSLPYTNTFTGNVAAPSGGVPVTNSIAPGLQCVGSLIPDADYVTNTASINLTVAGATILQIWDSVNQKYVPYKFSAGSWKNQITGLPEVPFISVGQGFFINPPSVTNNWVQKLP
jgi:hypothetical protein